MESVSNNELGRWFKVYASITDHPVFSDAQAYRAFSWCMRRACWRATYSHGKQIPRGSFWTTNRDGAVECHSSIETWRKAMAKLVELELVTIESTTTHTFVTIINYEKYQGEESGDGVLKNSTPTSTRTSTPTSTPTRAPTSTRSRSIRTGSNEELPAAAPPGDSSDRQAKLKATKAAYDPLAEPIPPSLDTPLFRQAWGKWVAYRKEIGKPLRQTGTAETLEKFVQLGQSAAIAMIDQSILSGWQGLFPSSSRAPQNSTSLNHRIASKIIQPVTYDPNNQKRLSGF